MHYYITDKPQRDMTFAEKQLRFEQSCNTFAANIDMVCQLKMVPSPHKYDTIKSVLAQVQWIQLRLFVSSMVVIYLHNTPGFWYL